MTLSAMKASILAGGLGLLTATLSANPPAGTPGSTPPWWNDAVFYEIFVRSFHDSDGDGIGDLQGLTRKLDYLNDGNPATDDDLGITGIWLRVHFGFMPRPRKPIPRGRATSRTCARCAINSVQV